MQASIYYLDILAGILTRIEQGFQFEYQPDYLQSNFPAISFSFPKTDKPYFSEKLFPFFAGLLAEGTNKTIQCRTLKIDENDDFTRLLKTANTETIGVITVREL
jgi:HipA-like protein